MTQLEVILASFDFYGTTSIRGALLYSCLCQEVILASPEQRYFRPAMMSAEKNANTLDNVVATGKILQEVLVDSNVGRSHRSTFSDISMVSKVRSFLLYCYLLGCIHLLHQILTLFTAYR